MSTLGVVFFTLPEARPSEESLESVCWADAVQIFSLSPDGSVASKEEVKSVARGAPVDWTLHLWGEERVEKELERDLRALVQRGVPVGLQHYRVPIRSKILDRWVDGSVWGPQPSLRLSRTTEAFPQEWWMGRKSSLEAASLRGWIGDYSACSLEGGLGRINAFSTLWARALEREGGGRGYSRWAFPVGIFARLMLRDGLIARGLAGLTFSTLVAYTALLGNAKLWEAEENKAEGWGPGGPLT